MESNSCTKLEMNAVKAMIAEIINFIIFSCFFEIV